MDFDDIVLSVEQVRKRKTNAILFHSHEILKIQDNKQALKALRHREHFGGY